MSLLQEKRPQAVIEGFCGTRHYQQIVSTLDDLIDGARDGIELTPACVLIG